MTAKNSIGRNM